MGFDLIPNSDLKSIKRKTALPDSCRKCFFATKTMLQFLLLLGTVAFTAIPAQALDAISKRKISEKLEFYRLSYPKFNYQTATKSAEENYPLVKNGDKISLQTHDGIITGIFNGIENGQVKIDNTTTALKDIPAFEHNRLLPSECEKLRKAHIENLFMAYTRKRSGDMDEYQKQLEEQFAIESEPETDAVTAKNKPERQSAAIVPRFAITVHNVLTSSGMVKTGDVVKNVKKTSFERYSFETEDGRTVSSDAVNIYVFKEINSLESFEITQCALALLAKNQYQDAYYYAVLAAKIDEAQKRSESVLQMIRDIQETSTAINVVNEQIAALNKDIELQARMLTANQNNLHDDFAVKAGTRDRSTSYAGKILVLREKRKAMQAEIKEKIMSSRTSFENIIKRTAAAGDYIAACTFMSVAEDHLQKFIDTADANWQPEELEEHKQWLIARKNFIAAEYQTRISRPFKDRWADFLDRYVAIFGYNEKEMAVLDVKPDYNNLNAAARNSFRLTRAYGEAATTGNFNAMFFAGMQIMTLLPDPNVAESINTGIDMGFKKIETAIAAINDAAARKAWLNVAAGCKTLTPLPLKLKKAQKEAQTAIAASTQEYRKAVAAEQSKDFDVAIIAATRALELCQDNPDAVKFYESLRKQHQELLREYMYFANFLSQKRYEEATEQWREMFKAMPQYASFVKQLRLRLEAEMDEFNRELLTADNSFKAGRYNDALTIYEKYAYREGLEKTYAVMLKQAEGRQEWTEVARLLELLGRWEEAGEIRRKHNLSK